jgi:hypothetical protein
MVLPLGVALLFVYRIVAPFRGPARPSWSRSSWPSCSSCADARSSPPTRRSRCKSRARPPGGLLEGTSLLGRHTPRYARDPSGHDADRPSVTAVGR